VQTVRVPTNAVTLLPREIEADPSHGAIRAQLAAVCRPLWQGGKASASVLPLRPPLATALRAAHVDGHLVLGLERAEEALAAEARGLDFAARRATSKAGARVSRLLLLSEDGAERLYRHVERLAFLHAPRVLVLVLSAGAATLGRATTGRDASVKVVLVQRKRAVAALLRALVA
jgi:hypothetical protein